jgi:hypothetical protein
LPAKKLFAELQLDSAGRKRGKLRGSTGWGMQETMGMQRNSARYSSLATIAINGGLKVSGMVKDISITGCRAEFEKCLDLDRTESYVVRIFPERESGIGAFGLHCRVAWMNTARNGCAIGFFLEKSSNLREFQSYLDFIAYAHSARRGIDRSVD